MECGKQTLSYTEIITYHGQVLMIPHIFLATNLSGSLSRKRLLKTQ